MTATNHALTGSAIGLLVGDPAVALPAAFLSHFVCDAIPHYGSSQEDDSWLKSRTFKQMLFLDAALCLVIVGVIGGLKPHNWLLACICAFLATSPDLFWINRFNKLNAGKNWKPSKYSRFAHVIQWFQRPIGAVVEVAWAVAALIVLVIITR